MDILSGLIKLFFGTKSDKDRKEIEPYVEKIKAVYPSIEKLSNDELRERSEALKRVIAEYIRPDEEKIVELKAELEHADTSLEDKERISKEVDRLTKKIDEDIEVKLEEILPEVKLYIVDEQTGVQTALPLEQFATVNAGTAEGGASN